MIDYEKSMGVEMKVLRSPNGCFEFQDDLSQWARKFLNARGPTIDIAGPVKLNDTSMDIILDEDDDSLDLFEENDSVESLREEDSLERFFNRNRINFLINRRRLSNHFGASPQDNGSHLQLPKIALFDRVG